MRFELLGELRAWRDGRPVDLGHLRQRCVLAVLLIEANQVVPADQLVERVWADAAPQSARTTLYGYLYRLRQALGADLIIKESAGYVLRVDRRDVDVHRFDDLLEQARAAQDRTGLLAQALGLWRGEALAQLDTPWLNGVRAELERRRFAAELEHTDLELRAGHHAVVLTRLPERLALRPFDERLTGQYLLALHRDGRRADALEHFQVFRRRLAEEIGTDPGPALLELHQQILTGDSPAETGSRPRQLPAAPRHFTGRDEALAQLGKAADAHPGAVAISVITGTGGIGKTSLALHWAYENLDRFPDGQLCVDLHGFDPVGEPKPAAVVLRGFLGALGVDARSLPADEDALVAMYRSATAGRRLLILLDNAASAEQVGPLLPGSPTCTVVVTSRRQLIDLGVRYGAHSVRLDVLAGTDAAGVLASHIGHQRVAAEPDAARELLDWCAGLPIAISLAGAHAALRPDFPLAALTEDLRAAELPAGLTPIFRCSYQRLDPVQARMFRLLGRAPGEDISLLAAARLADLPPREARRVLGVLVDNSLLQQHVPGRYRMHDLIRLAAREEGDDDVRPLVRFYLGAAFAGERLLNPHRAEIEPLVAPEPVPDALEWFDAEHANLLAAQKLAADQGWHGEAWQLAWAMSGYERRRGLHAEALAAWTLGVVSADLVAVPEIRNLARRSLGDACARLDRHEEAVAYLTEALSIGDDRAVAHTHVDLERAWELRGDDRTARSHALEALRLFRATGDPVWEADALNAAGWFSAKLGEYDDARTSCQAALELAARHGYRECEAASLDSLGYIAHHTGQHEEAAGYYERALAAFRDLRDVYQEANTLERFADAHRGAGHPERARSAWQQALELYRRQNRSAEVARVESRLRTEFAR